MSFVSTGAQGILWPRLVDNMRPTSTAGGFSTFAASSTVDAAAEKIAFIGHVFWEGSPSAAKTMDSTSKVHWRSGTVTFANASTNLRVGLQDVSTSAGPPARPDGTFDVYKDLVPGTDTIGGNSWIVTTLNTSGSKSVTHGDLIAIVFDMTARAGSDSVAIPYGLGAGSAGQDRQNVPTVVSQVGGTWSVNTTAAVPNVMIEASDGTLGVLYGSYFLTTGSAYSFSSSSSPDEYGLIFQVPFRCKVGGLRAIIGSTAATADFSFKLYSDPLGTPTLITSKACLGEQFAGFTDDRYWQDMLTAEPILEPNTDYCLSVEATAAGSLDLGYISLLDAAHARINGVRYCRRGSRTNGTGAFSETDTQIPFVFPILSQIDDGTGPGHANFHLGMN